MITRFVYSLYQCEVTRFFCFSQILNKKTDLIIKFHNLVMLSNAFSGYDISVWEISTYPLRESLHTLLKS